MLTKIRIALGYSAVGLLGFILLVLALGWNAPPPPAKASDNRAIYAETKAKRAKVKRTFHDDPEIHDLIATLRVVNTMAMPVIEVQTWKWERHYGANVSAQGRVRNISLVTLNGPVVADITFEDGDGNVVGYIWNYVHTFGGPFASGGVADFTAVGTVPRSAKRASLQFRLGNRVVAHRVAGEKLRFIKPVIVAAQKGLNVLGFDAGEPDGVIGPATLAAVKRFGALEGFDRGFLLVLEDRLRAYEPPVGKPRETNARSSRAN